MSPRSFMLLVGLAIVAVVVAVVLILMEDEPGFDNPEAGALMFPALDEILSEDPNQLTQLEIETPSYTITLELNGLEWVATSFGGYPVKIEPVVEIVTSLAAMTRVEPKTSNPDWYGFIGIADPSEAESIESIRISASTSDGEEAMNALFGFRSGSIGFTRYGGMFVRALSDEEAWLVEGVIEVPSFAQDWFESPVSIPGTAISSVAIYTGDTLEFRAEKVNFDTADYELTFLSEAFGPEGTMADDSQIRSLTQGIVSTIIEDARPIDSLDFSDADRTVRFETRTGLTLDIRLVEADGALWLAYEATAEPGSEAEALATQITRGTDRWALQVPTYRTDALNRPIEQLITLPEPPPEQPALPAGGLLPVE